MGNNKRTYLYGLGFYLNIKSFKYLKVNLYLRDKPEVESSTYQITFAWRLPFSLGNHRFHFTGFSDFAGKEGPKVANQLIVPQLLLGIGSYWKQAETLFVGVEFQYWRNKFGLEGVTERVPQAMAKWYF